MQTVHRDDSLEIELRTLIRLRLKHPTKSREAKSYRHAIIDRVHRLGACGLARRANWIFSFLLFGRSSPPERSVPSLSKTRNVHRVDALVTGLGTSLENSSNL